MWREYPSIVKAYEKIYGPGDLDGPYGSRDPKWNAQTEDDKQLVSKPPGLPIRTKLEWVGVDLDGTLASPWHKDMVAYEIGDPIWENVEKLKAVVAAGYKAIVHTSRPWSDYENIKNWLTHYEIPFKEIQCGKPLFAAYIDDRAVRADDESWMPRDN
jgi:hypothetical protein